MNLKQFFVINADLSRRRWEFYPGEDINSTRYSVSFSEAATENDAWKTLNLSLQKSPDFYFKQIDFINIRKDLLI